MPGRQAYVIRSSADPESFWNNEDGWVAFAAADRFTLRETKRLRLPIGGIWVHLHRSVK